MPRWLSSTWEPNWRSFRYFNLYRMVLATIFCLAILFPNDWMVRLNLFPSPLIFGLLAVYSLSVMAGLIAAGAWQRGFNRQLSAQMTVDIVFVSLLMHHAGGVGSGLSVLLLVSLAGGSLVGQGRLVLFYAAMATVAVLLSQFLGILAGRFDPGSIVQAGFISAGFFATAILARLLGQRVMANEELARRRGEALDHQIRINQRIVERMQDGVLIVDKGGMVSRCNPVARSMLALTDESAVALADQVPALAAALQLWRERDGETAFPFDAPEGRELQARFEQTSGAADEVLVFLEDIGRIKERAQQLKLASLGRLTASIAHEIRNPLSAIGHAGELLREERRGEMQERLLRILNDNVTRLDRIVRDILELGRQNRAEPELLQADEFCASFLEQFSGSENLLPAGCPTRLCIFLLKRLLLIPIASTKSLIS